MTMGAAIPVLTYHSQNIDGNEYHNNDHVALAADLALIDALGLRVVPLQWVVDWHQGERSDQELAGGVALTFDDGTDFDARDLHHPSHGAQTSFANILRAFDQQQTGNHHVQATSFVIAGPQARTDMAHRCLAENQWMNDDWWGSLQAEGLIDVQNHGWDHNHPAVDKLIEKQGRSGSFAWIDTEAECRAQVIDAARYIAERRGSWPQLFAYPFGDSSDYIRDTFFPNFAAEHQTRAAFGANGEMLTRQSPRWDLPRLVCGFHWRSSDELRALLEQAQRSWQGQAA